MKVFVTGSRGFIGRNLMKLLGDSAVGFDLKDDDFSSNDITDCVWLKRKMAGCDYVIHLAAISSLQEVDKNPAEAIETNITGTLNVLQIAKALKVKKVIVVSSASVEEPYSSIYAMTKQATENLAQQYDNAIIARLYNVYGRGSKSVVSKFIRDIKRGKRIVLNGNTIRDYIAVDEVVENLKNILGWDTGWKIYKIGTGKGTSLKELVEIIERIVDRRAKVKQGKPIKEIQESECPISHFITQPLEDSIRRIYGTH